MTHSECLSWARSWAECFKYRISLIPHDNLSSPIAQVRKTRLGALERLVQGPTGAKLKTVCTTGVLPSCLCTFDIRLWEMTGMIPTGDVQRFVLPPELFWGPEKPVVGEL